VDRVYREEAKVMHPQMDGWGTNWGIFPGQPQSLRPKFPGSKWPKTQLKFRPLGPGHMDINNCTLF